MPYPSALAEYPPSTWCSVPVLVRSLGTDHTLASRSTSSQAASRTSRDRYAVRTRNSNASFVEPSALEFRTLRNAAATSPCGIALWCVVLFPTFGSAAFLVPDRDKAAHDGGRFDGVHPHVTDLRIGVDLERRLPRDRRLGVPPVRAVQIDHRGRSFPERRNVLFGQQRTGVGTDARELSIVVGRLTRLAERSQRIGPRPRSRRRPRMVSRCTQGFAPVSLTSSIRPSSS